ncbi:unnamed protein product [Vitrella brassicaformis CCMP3155]|uniref:Uncharacterized protein n=1 Tax=Vitrella brassicaformis (strain CCMP3155) TaxID=1169540 RepID=A0A0G4GXA3_VITBC|nr:unnamed protein product [Vitrella brassicaformis CCMP3155]|eukprot:CEM35706.1 unnamed protein product [Vitrella brassicaformis CCMP3155]
MTTSRRVNTSQLDRCHAHRRFLCDRVANGYATAHFEKIEDKLREVRAKEEVPAQDQPLFGGLSMLLFGDVTQFGPVSGTALWEREKVEQKSKMARGTE